MYTLNHQKHSIPCFLTDRIYPSWRIFASASNQTKTESEKHYTKKHESVRKDIERAFGALKKRFRILKLRCRLHLKESMYNITYCCIIIHNMNIDAMVNSEVHSAYTNRRSSDDASGIDVFLNRGDLYNSETELYSKVTHLKLQADLVHECASEPYGFIFLKYQYIT